MKFQANATTGQVTSQEMTLEELAQDATNRAEFAAMVAIEEAEAEAKAAARAALLNKLGITADEAALLLG